MAEKRRTDSGKAVAEARPTRPATDSSLPWGGILSALTQEMPDSQARALEEQVRRDLENALFPESWFGFDASLFTMSMDAEKEPLAAYMRRLAPVQLADQKCLTPLYGLADFLDRQADPANDAPLALFIPDGFFISGDKKLFVSKPYLRLLSVDPSLNRVTRFQRTEGALWLHPDLDGAVSLAAANPHQAALYGWALLIAWVWLGVAPAPRRTALDQLARCRVHCSTLPPNAVDMIAEVVNGPVTGPSPTTCRGLLDMVVNAFLHNPLFLKGFLCSEVKQESFFYSIPGRHKKHAANEDRTGVLSAKNAVLLYVADGVSTADVGTGETAATLTHLVFLNRQGAFADWSRSALSKQEAWREEAHAFLRQAFLEADASVADWLNRQHSCTEEEAASLHPMCTTLSAAVVCGNQAVVHTVGDSPVLLYQHASRKLLKLSIEHTVAMEREDTERVSLGEDCTDEHLTRVIGAHWDSATHCYAPNACRAHEFEVQLEAGDILVIASDGLLKCISAYDERAAMEKVQHALATGMAEGAALSAMGKRLTKLADDGQSNDNISVSMLRASQDIAQAKGE